MRRVLRGKARVAFPIASVLIAILIVASPFMGGPLAFLHELAFARFCMFWCLGVCIVLTTSARPLRPAVVALIAGAGLSMLLAAVLPKVNGERMVQWGSLVLFAAAFIALRKWKLNPILVMWVCGGVSLAVKLIGDNM